jgi:two-component system, OmpR family, sensor histidine kinase ChvG
MLAAAERRRMQVANRGFSSITRRIVLLNLAGLVALVAGILYLSEYRANLVDARVQSLLTQGEIIAGAIAASATADVNAVAINPDRLLELQQGETYGPGEDILAPLDFPINPERVAPLLRRLITPTDTRARIYDRDGTLLLDSRTLYTRGDILRFDLPPPVEQQPGPSQSSSRSNGIPSISGSSAANFRFIPISGRQTEKATRKSQARSTA